jgi:hypothetical protein
VAVLLSKAIVAICVSAVNPQYNTACDKALDAGTRQVGMRTNTDGTEDKATQIATNYVQDEFGKDSTYVIGAGAFAYKTAKDRSVTFKLPTLGIADSISNQITTNSYTLNVRWNF